MIAPNMATMLGYIATDINLPANVLSECLNEACQLSFNSISVDGDTSTNDSVFLLASASADNIGIDRAEDPKLSDFRAKLRDVMQDLAIQIVRDGEGKQARHY